MYGTCNDDDDDIDLAAWGRAKKSMMQNVRGPSGPVKVENLIAAATAAEEEETKLAAAIYRLERRHKADMHQVQGAMKQMRVEFRETKRRMSDTLQDMDRVFHWAAEVNLDTVPSLRARVRALENYLVAALVVIFVAVLGVWRSAE